MKAFLKFSTLTSLLIAYFKSATLVWAQLEDFEKVTNSQLDAFNPLKIAGSTQTALSTPGGIISRVLFFAFPIAGLILFVMIFWGGFEILSGAASKKSMDAGKQRITAAVIGFFLLFISYWLVKLVELVFGVKIF